MDIPPELKHPSSVLAHKVSLAPEPNEALGKPPVRLSPFKGKMAQLSSAEIFAATPKRIQSFKSQSVDRQGFNPVVLAPSNRPEIKFEHLKRLAPSKALVTPSRMISGNMRKPQSEQISRLNRPTVASTLKSGGTVKPNANLLDQFKAKSILKRKFSPPILDDSQQEGPQHIQLSSTDRAADLSSSFDQDQATTLNTMRNTGIAKDVLNLLSDPEYSQPRKKRRTPVVTFEKKSVEITNTQIMEVLQRVLQNQDTILKRLEKLESKSSS